MKWKEIEQKIDAFFDNTDAFMKKVVFWTIRIAYLPLAVIVFFGSFDLLFHWKMKQFWLSLLVIVPGCLFMAWGAPLAVRFVLNNGPEKWVKGQYKRLRMKYGQDKPPAAV